MYHDDSSERPQVPMQRLPLPEGACVSVEAATLEDWPAIAELLLFDGLPTQGVCAHLDEFVTARVDGDFAGTARWCIAEGHFRVGLLAVLPERQQQGIGRALQSVLGALARSRGETLLSVEVDDSCPFFAEYGPDELNAVPRVSCETDVQNQG